MHEGVAIFRPIFPDKGSYNIARNGKRGVGVLNNRVNGHAQFTKCGQFLMRHDCVGVSRFALGKSRTGQFVFRSGELAIENRLEALDIRT